MHWSGGVVNYYIDQGPLNSQISNQQATAMVDAAAALWSAVPTAGVLLITPVRSTRMSMAPILSPATGICRAFRRCALSDRFPLAVIYDADGSVINALFGAGASDPTSCQNNGVLAWLDNIQPDATIAHAVILLNGLCATNSNLCRDDAV